ncbi:MAG TPA: cyanophycinase [Clostridiaceae bacterium]|nr:cyanophycinase [Clostridiaceae bacterium]
MKEKVKGNLLVIGGAEDREGECRILKYFVEISGKEKARLAILTTANENPDTAGKEYFEIFKNMNVEDIQILNIHHRDDANYYDYVEIINNATGIFFTGGDQLRITSILGGTKVHDALYNSYQRGVTIAGTSAGASVMSSTMIIEGDSNDPARKCTLKMAPGLGLLEEVIIDQHFHQRGRIGRLLCSVAENPYMLGVGIDEDTAIRVYPDGYFIVIGSNSVTVVDGKSIKTSNVSELQPDEILAISNITLHMLPEGYGYDLRSREVREIQKAEGKK